MTDIPPEAQAAAEAHILHRITFWRVAAGQPDSIKLDDVTLMARRNLIADALEAAAPAIREAERQRIRRDLLDGDPGKLEQAFREFVDPEEAADCALAVADLIGGDA